ncbi:hypothetical protein AALC25_17235 [Lachnospiraceae bacterium 29-84]
MEGKTAADSIRRMFKGQPTAEQIEALELAYSSLGMDCGGWIYCGDGKNMPKEHDSIFAELKGTDRWSNAMFEKTSDEVNATIEFEDGKRAVKTLHTIDGRWNGGDRGLKFKVIAWKPLPEPFHRP